MMQWLEDLICPVKTMKWSQYVQIKKPIYSYLRLTPDTSIRNYNSSAVAKMVHLMQKKITQRISLEERKLIFETEVKCCYIIDIYKTTVEFYFVVPQQYTNIAIEKILEVWPKITIKQVEALNPISPTAVKYALNYKKEDGLSLSVDKKSNEPLNNILNVLDIMQDKDRVTILYNFMPYNQRGWVTQYDKMINKLKKNTPLDRNTLSVKYIAIYGLIWIADLLDGLLDMVRDMGGGKQSQKPLSLVEVAATRLDLSKDLDIASRKKRTDTILKTQMIITSESEDKGRKKGNALAVCQAYRGIEGDNELIYKKLPDKAPIMMNGFKVPGAEVNKMSISECQNLIQLPGRELLTQFKIIPKIDVNQTEVPETLQNGILNAGANTFKGKITNVFHTEHKELKNLAVCVCGPNRSGKSTLLANMVYNAIRSGSSVIVPDFCGKCQLSDELAAVIPKDKILVIDCGDYTKLQGFGYNEIKPRDNSVFELYNCAKMKAARLKDFINLINDGDNDLEGRMERYLEYAALIVFVSNGSVNDVFKMIKDYKLRHEFIDRIPTELIEIMEEYVMELCEIDEIAQKGENAGEVIGTKQGHISAILSRVHRLKQNAYIEMMLKKSVDNNVNLMSEMQAGKLILIKMYDNMFVSQQQKDIYVSYWITKVWGALQNRFCNLPQDELKQVMILIDELYQVRNCERYLTMILSQIPKYRAKLVLSCHHLAQIPTIQEELKSALCSYMFLRGSNKKNFYSMKEEFEDKEFALDDLLHLKQYESLNLFAYEDGYWAGITKLPPPIK
jgi:hypothetical protein